MQQVNIRRARAEEASTLTDLSLASKAHWKYPQNYYRLWQQELTITADYINEHTVYVCESGGGICGYYSLVELEEDLSTAGIVLKAGIWLEHMFVHPETIGEKIGTRMFNHLCGVVEGLGGSIIHLLADPHARLFYEKMGCVYQQEYCSSIPGRTTPYLIFELHNRVTEKRVNV